MKENKTCSKCGEEKPITAEFFYRRKISKDGFYGWCKVCTAKVSKDYMQANREEVSKKNKEYYEANRELIIKRAYNWKQDNPESAKQWYHTKNAKQPACVYQILNNQNGWIYIGETMRGKLRWQRHLRDLRGNRHPNKLIQEDFNKFGKEAFEFSIIKELPKDKQVLLYEEVYIIFSLIKEGKNLYNRTLTLTIDQLMLLQETENKT
tara:strand:+ start:3812 stop:4432 length:621 start_codon:yes stop_codon:yes gene_type:complete